LSDPKPIAKSTNWSAVETEEVLPGVHRQTMHATNQSVVRYLYAPGSVFPIHAHPEEQVTLVLSGTIVFEIDGSEHRLTAGGVIAIPSNVPHGARVEGTEAVESFNILSPRRAADPVVAIERRPV
jgi:quercetin dioxygenase-like cupin family protein